MIDRLMGNPIPIPCGLVVKKGVNSFSACLGVDSRAGILHGHLKLSRIREGGLDQQPLRLAIDTGGGLNGVHHQIEDDLLQLNPVRAHRRNIERPIRCARKYCAGWSHDAGEKWCLRLRH